MHPEKVAFLFGESPHGADPDDPDDRVELLSREVSVVGETEFDMDAYLVALERLPIPSDDPVIEVLLDQVFGHLISPNGPLEMLAGGPRRACRVVHRGHRRDPPAV